MKIALKMVPSTLVWVFITHGLLGSVCADTAFSADEVQAFVDAHNLLRRQESSSDMSIMKWNDELANMAQEYVDLCTGEHGQAQRDNPPFSYIGQNIYATSAATVGDIKAVVDYWYSEKQYFSYGGNSCSAPAGKACGHYTQVVWAKTTDVGCGFKKCDNLGYPTQVYCNYGIGGNMNNERPYQLGKNCSTCKSGSGFCNDGLCDDTCTKDSCDCDLSCQNCADLDSDSCKCTCKPGTFGNTCESKCENANAYCGGNPGWPESWCGDSEYPFVDANCPALCGQCTASDADPCA